MSIEDFRGNYRWLSNFELADVELDGVVYKSVEHAYQAAKTRDAGQREEICRATTCGQAKKLGQKVTLRHDWDSVKLDVMRDLLRQKFKHPHLREKLILTARQHLVEGNTWGDVWWGVCDGNGLNHLGRLLMDIREEIVRSGG